MAGENRAMKTPGHPPQWAEVILERLLSPEHRSTVTGDLREEYTEVILPQKGRLKAYVWYLRQVASLAPSCLSQQRNVRGMLLLASLLTLSCGGWLAVMETLLRHPGYVARFITDVCIALVPLATILAVILRLGVRAERSLWAGAIALIGIASRAIVSNARSTHFEGFVLLVGLALTLQAILMLLALGNNDIGSGPIARANKSSLSLRQ
jgi:hypothetical protein